MKKLVLKKDIVARINNGEMQQLKGGNQPEKTGPQYPTCMVTCHQEQTCPDYNTCGQSCAGTCDLSCRLSIGCVVTNNTGCGGY